MTSANHSSARVNIQRTLRDALLAVVALSPGLLAGCGPGPGIEEDPNFVPMSCVNGEPQFTEGLTPSQAADSVTLARDVTQGFRFGACQDSICIANLDVVRGSESIEIATREGVLEFLGAIDTPAEAMLLAQIAGFSARCGHSGTRPAGDGFDVQTYAPVGCDGRDRVLLHVDVQGEVTQTSRVEEKKADPNCVVGRRPAGLWPPARERDPRSSADYLARAAELEAASVFAFERLARELSAHGAPTMLSLRARAAARDERRHARSVTVLARRFGAVPERPRVTRQGLRELEALALENAVEGCVRETYGAVVGAWQAQHAKDRAVARVYQVIAKEEARHAALAWRVARFAESRLSRAAQQRVAQARAGAVTELYHVLKETPSAAIRYELGVPHVAQALLLADELQRRLWS